MNALPYETFPIAEGLNNMHVQELSLLMRAAYRAGRIIRDGYDQLQTIEEKAYGDLVSQIDEECDLAVIDEIQQQHPNDLILSEEVNPDSDISKGRGWVIDPLDATSAMLFRSSPDMPSAMVARTLDGKPLYSVVHFPLTNEMFYAIRGQGAYRDGQRLQCDDRARLRNAWVEMNQQANSRNESLAFRLLREKLRLPGGARLVSSSPPHSGIGVRIAEGYKRVSAVVHDNNAKPKPKQAPWDVIPVQLILEEAGGAVVDLDGKPYDPFSPKPFIMAASKGLAREILDLSKPQKAGRFALWLSRRRRPMQAT